MVNDFDLAIKHMVIHRLQCADIQQARDKKTIFIYFFISVLINAAV